jgi:hypothetical protein
VAGRLLPVLSPRSLHIKHRRSLLSRCNAIYSIQKKARLVGTAQPARIVVTDGGVRATEAQYSVATATA